MKLSKQDMLDAAAEAENLMRSQPMENFFERAEASLFERWKLAAIDEDEQKTLHLQYLGLQAFKEFMHKVIVDGQMARRDIDGNSTNPR